MPKVLKRILIALGALIALLLVGFGILLLVLRNPLPEGTANDKAEARARSIAEACNVSGWRSTGAVRWTFRGSRHHLWDRTRQLARVRWDEIEVLVRIRSRNGRAFERGSEVGGARGRELVEKGYAYWANDSFWLTAPFKLQDPGATRKFVRLDDGRSGVLMHYGTGGVTPGDRYLFLAEAGKRPSAWRMWVSVLPVGGIEFSIGGWKRIATGAWLATRHGIIGLSLDLDNVAGAAALTTLEPGPDPFGRLLQSKNEPTTRPAR